MTTVFAYPPRRTPFLRRTMDATRLNAAANHPDVRPWLGGDGPIDLTALLADPKNVAFDLGGHGGFVLVNHGNGRYEAHSMVEPEGRGVSALRGVAEALEYLFTVTDANEIVTKVPTGNVAATALTRAGGFEHQFMSRIRLDAAHAPMTNCYTLGLEQWLFRADAPRVAGEWFHSEIDRLLALNGSSQLPHDEDPVHNRAAGAAVLMARAGNGEKAAYFYNRWALLAGYATIEVVGTHPTRLDFHTMVVEMRADEAEVLLCR